MRNKVCNTHADDHLIQGKKKEPIKQLYSLEGMGTRQNNRSAPHSTSCWDQELGRSPVRGNEKKIKNSDTRPPLYLKMRNPGRGKKGTTHRKRGRANNFLSNLLRVCHTKKISSRCHLSGVFCEKKNFLEWG